MWWKMLGFCQVLEVGMMHVASSTDLVLYESNRARDGWRICMLKGSVQLVR